MAHRGRRRRDVATQRHRGKHACGRRRDVAEGGDVARHGGAGNGWRKTRLKAARLLEEDGDESEIAVAARLANGWR